MAQTIDPNPPSPEPRPRAMTGTGGWAGPVPRGETRTLFLVSVLGLFLELMLIRWIGTEIRIFAYLQNTVLVVCFMGLGMGCWTCRRPASLLHVLVPLLLLVLLLASPPMHQVSEMLSV